MASNWIKQKSWSSEEECLDAIPDDWKARQVEDIYIQQDIGRRYEKKSTKSAGATPVIDQSAYGFIGWHDSDPGVTATTEDPVVTFANHTCEMRLVRHPFSVIQNVFPLKGKTGDCDTEYFYYSTKGIVRLEEYKGHYPQFRERWIGLPTLSEQKTIAYILGTLDDKIELNRKTNETLEAMAKALFKSWFVDFDPVRAKAEGRPTGLPAEISDLFPDSFEDSELGEIPSGWEVGGLEEFLVLQRGFDLPAPQRIKGAYPVVAASGVSGTHNEPMAFAPGVVTGRSGVLGKVFYIQTDFFPLNTTLWAKEFRLATPIYGYFLLCDIDFAVFNAGSAVPTLNRNHLGSLRFPLPPKALVVSFTDVAVDLMKRKEGIVAETSNLSATRDALLPKLISGEIRIPDAEKMLEEVGV